MKEKSYIGILKDSPHDEWEICSLCGSFPGGGMCKECGGTLEGYPAKKDNQEEQMPFHHEGVLWVFCVLCNKEVKVSSSHAIGKVATYRVCNSHAPEMYKHIIRELKSYGN